MAARSFTIKIQNLSGQTLERTGMSLSWGIWADNNGETPPEQLKPGATATFGAESDGMATGCEGQVVYGSDAGNWTIYFDNPYVGSNQFSVATPPGYPPASYGDISGNDATVRVILVPPED
jgi:Aegerolysin